MDSTEAPNERAGKKNFAYLSVKPPRWQLYKDLWDYWNLNSPEGRLACTQKRCYTIPDGVEYLQRADGHHIGDVGGR